VGTEECKKRKNTPRSCCQSHKIAGRASAAVTKTYKSEFSLQKKLIFETKIGGKEHNALDPESEGLLHAIAS